MPKGTFCGFVVPEVPGILVTFLQFQPVLVGFLEVVVFFFIGVGFGGSVCFGGFIFVGFFFCFFFIFLVGFFNGRCV